MFLRFYGLNEQPFGMTPDPRFMYQSGSHREAFASLVYGIESGRGFVGLIAEPGMGKTTLLFQLMERLRNSARTVFLFQTQRDSRELLCNLIADLGLDPRGQDVGVLQRQLNEILVREAQMGCQFVLIVDESQNLTFPVLESVRMLSNFETPRRKLMQIVLAGQPALADKLARPELEQLKQRISVICRLEPFTEKEAAGYVSHRLETAGYKGGRLFSDEALSILAKQSGGIPRNINNLCFHALSLGYAKGQKKIDRQIMEEVLSDLKLDTLQSKRANLQTQIDQAHGESGGLEGVTLNDASQGEDVDDFRVAFRGLRNSRSSVHSGSVTGGGGLPQRNPRWLFWVVAVLALVLAGEVFWAYLPPNASTHSITQFVDGAVGHAKEVVLNLKPKVNGSHGQQPVKPAAMNGKASNDAGSQQAQGATLLDLATSTANSTAGKPSTGNPSDEKVVDSSKAPDPSSEVTGQSAALKTSDSNGQGKSSMHQSQPSADLAKGKVVVESNVDGSAITINGKNEPGWQTPHIFSLAPGMYQIAISKPGYSTWFRDVQITGGNKKWVIAHMRAPRGVIVIDTQPPGMQVFIDGKAYGPSEVEASLSVGTHTYEVIPPGGQKPVKGTFVLKAGSILTRKIKWLPSGGGSSAQNMPDSEKPNINTNSRVGREQS